MVNVTFTDKVMTYDKFAFYQYDYGRSLVIYGLTLPEEVQVHFARVGRPADIVIGTTVNGVTTVKVPAVTLQTDGEFTAYIFVATETTGQTYKAISFQTRKREKPGDYAPPDEPNVVQELMDRLNQIIATGIADYTPDPVVVENIVQTYVTENLINNSYAATLPGTALDAVKGKELNDGKLDKTGDSKDNTVSFTEALSDSEIGTGEKHSTIIGKIVKRFKAILALIGLLPELTTENKTSIVNAINEVNAKPGGTDGAVTFEDYTVTAPIPTPEESLPLIVTGATIPVLMSKIKAFLSGTVTISKITNNLTTIDSGLVLDARQGKVLQDQVATISDNLGVVTEASGSPSVATDANISACSLALQAGTYIITANVNCHTTVLCERSARIRQGDETYIAIQSVYSNEWSTSNVVVAVAIELPTVFHCVAYHKAGATVVCDGTINAIKIK